MSTFNVGDRVRLTGWDWAPTASNQVPHQGLEVVIVGHDDEGDPTFLWNGEQWYVYSTSPGGDFSAVLVEAAPEPVDPFQIVTSDEAVEAFKAAWHEADAAGQVGNRVRAGLNAVALLVAEAE